MPHPARQSFASGVLNSLAANIAILNSNGEIIEVNNSWKQFASENNSPDAAAYVGRNYLAVCEGALTIEHDETVEQAYRGLSSMIKGGAQECSVEYPCHSPAERRWFLFRATWFEHEGERYIVILHENITNRKQADLLLRESEERFRTLAQILPDTIYTLDLAAQKVTFFNRESFLGYSKDELLGPDSIQAKIHPDDRPAVLAHWQELVDGKSSSSAEYRVLSRSEKWEWVDSRKTVLSTNPDGTPSEIVVILREITDRKTSEAQIAYQASLLENVNDVIIGTDAGFIIRYWNRAAERLFGYPSAEATGRPVTEILRTQFIGDGLENSSRSVAETGFWKGEVIQYTRNHVPVNIDANIIALRDSTGTITGYVSANRDITSRRKAEEEIAQVYRTIEDKNLELKKAYEREQILARTDGLTGIFNHRHFIDLATYEFANAIRYDRPLSIILFDIDHFKTINDTRGHLAGDRILWQVAHTAEKRLRNSDVIARYGGEEFAILVPNVTSAGALIVAEDIRGRVLSATVDEIAGIPGVSISLGISQILPSGDSLEKMIRRADEALYRAKETGRNRTEVYA